MAIIFTPDDTHYAIAAACLSRGAHALPPPRTQRTPPCRSHAQREVRERCPRELSKRGLRKVGERSEKGPREVRPAPRRQGTCAHIGLVPAGMHVLVTKPPVKTLREHNELTELARQAG